MYGTERLLRDINCTFSDFEDWTTISEDSFPSLESAACARLAAISRTNGSDAAGSFSLPEGVSANFSLLSDPPSIRVWRESSFLSVETTWLRRDPTYYRLYCIGLNTVFATLVPLLTLMFFNVSTVRALHRLGKQVRNFWKDGI